MWWRTWPRLRAGWKMIYLWEKTKWIHFIEASIKVFSFCISKSRRKNVTLDKWIKVFNHSLLFYNVPRRLLDLADPGLSLALLHVQSGGAHVCDDVSTDRLLRVRIHSGSTVHRGNNLNFHFQRNCAISPFCPSYSISLGKQPCFSHSNEKKCKGRRK